MQYQRISSAYVQLNPIKVFTWLKLNDSNILVRVAGSCGHPAGGREAGEDQRCAERTTKASLQVKTSSPMEACIKFCLSFRKKQVTINFCLMKKTDKVNWVSNCPFGCTPTEKHSGTHVNLTVGTRRHWMCLKVFYECLYNTHVAIESLWFITSSLSGHWSFSCAILSE